MNRWLKTTTCATTIVAAPNYLGEGLKRGTQSRLNLTHRQVNRFLKRKVVYERGK